MVRPLKRTTVWPQIRTMVRPLYRTMVLALVLLITLLFHEEVEGTVEGEIIGEWAEKFGEELWDLGKRITKAPDIKNRYKSLNIRVEYKDGPSLLRSAVETVGRMLSRKMDAIRCIQQTAEDVAEEYAYNITQNLTYYSAKYSMVEGEDPPFIVKALKNNTWMYRNMTFNVDTHFYNIPVNTSYSSVHVPTNVYDLGSDVNEAIGWSEALDDVFVQNYNSDPALSWQYFGSYTGMLRQYPAISWISTEDLPDLFDCRTRSWYIEAATCSKDMVILFDNSGSMAGYGNHIAKFTVKELLETLSNNDFVNILSFSNDTYETVSCFSDMLVQATPDNLRIFNEAIATLEPEGHANFTLAFMRAFELLEEYRIKRGCNQSDVGCNQAIMLVTDGVPGNLTHVFETYNWLNNGSYIPVRVFTYLIGKEVTNVREIQWMACLNRGYYVHIKSIHEVQEMVLKYISVIARPLVLQETDHPITWTHAYADITLQHSEAPRTSSYREEYRLMTAAAIPLYDRKINRQNDTRTANLLGVAGTDVPIDDIDKLTLPYKLGVNGYSFIVSNNGYLMLHPDLRPVYKGILKENYNSVDVVEVEMIDDDDNPNTPEVGLRELGKKVVELRRAMVLGEEGAMLNLSVRFHYDHMRRGSHEKQDYYYAPLPNTPFSLGLVLPHGYGSTWIKVGDEIRRNQHLGLKVHDFFTGDNWKVHPKWVYCKYHYLEGHEFDTPEDELLHFLHKMAKPDWKWSQQYEPELDSFIMDDLEAGETGEPRVNCGRKTLDDDAYFCNKELVQLLVFDAKVTDPFYNTWEFKDEDERQLFVKYNASLRFAATMSGLTRWQFVFGEDMNDTMREFGDYHTQAIDETWYRSAILQHQVEPESFVFSVDHKTGTRGNVEAPVTASHAVFPVDGGLKAPAAVLGYQMSHKLMHRSFMEITSQTTKCEDCMKTCASDEQDCYVIDNSGFVILSEKFNDTGTFFGLVEGPVMEAMVKADIYKRFNVYDLQGVCFKSVLKSSNSNILATPLHYLGLAVNWIMAQISWVFVKTQLSSLWPYSNAFMISDDDEYYDDNDDMMLFEGDDMTTAAPTPRKPPRKGQDIEEEEYFNTPPKKVWVQEHFPCDRMADIYVLQQRRFIESDGFMAFGPTNSSRPYFVKRIPYSNLVMVIVNTMYPAKDLKLYAGARPALGESGMPGEGTVCNKLKLAELDRRRLEGCYTDHPLEHEVEACGRSSDVYLSFTVLVISWCILTIAKYAV